MITGSSDGILTVIDIYHHKIIKTIRSLEKILQLKLSPSGKYILTITEVSDEGRVNLIDISQTS